MKTVFRNELLSRVELESRSRQHVKDHGESVWQRNVVIGKTRFAMSHMWTSRLAGEFVRLPLETGEPDSWIVGISEVSWRLYLREGEHYSEGGSRYFKPPIKVAIKSPNEFVELVILPKEMWWQAPFACPYCSRLCVAQSHCKHALIYSGHIQETFRDTRFHSLYQEMWDRKFHCNLQNAQIEGLVVKMHIDGPYREWFREAYVYIECPEILPEIERVLAIAKQYTVDIVS